LPSTAPRPTFEISANANSRNIASEVFQAFQKFLELFLYRIDFSSIFNVKKRPELSPEYLFLKNEATDMSSEALDNWWIPDEELAPLDPFEKDLTEPINDDASPMDLICSTFTGTCGHLNLETLPSQIFLPATIPWLNAKPTTAACKELVDLFALSPSVLTFSGEAPCFVDTTAQEADSGPNSPFFAMNEGMVIPSTTGVELATQHVSREISSPETFAFENSGQMSIDDDHFLASHGNVEAICSQNRGPMNRSFLAPSFYCSSASGAHIISTTTRSDALEDATAACSRYDSSTKDHPRFTQKPPTTAGITLEDLKAVFHMHRPEAERRLKLKRTTFSNLSRHYGIAKWPFRTLRDAENRIAHNKNLLATGNLSRDRRSKITSQQRRLHAVKALMYEEPWLSKDSNTLSTLLKLVESRELDNAFN
jgi:RWP-RK domain